MNILNKLIFIFLIWTLSANLFGQSATLVYFNDAHELSPVMDNFGNRGGIARLKTVINHIIEKDSSAFVIFGGDLAGGTLCGALFKGHPQVQAFNKLPVHLANFGQHDFDHGIENTEALISSSHFSWCTSNLKNELGESFSGLPEFYIRKINGIQIGFICLTDAMHTTTPTTQIIQKDLLESIRSVLTKFPKDLDRMIAVTQTDPEMNRKIMSHFPQIDVILTEEVSENETHIFYHGKRPIISPCGNIGSAVEIKLEKMDNKIRNFVTVHSLDTTVSEDLEFVEIEQVYHEKINMTLSEPITYTKTPLEAGIASDHGCRWRDTTLGNMISDAFRNYYQTDLAFINGGGIRADIPSGKVTLKKLYALLPFGNNIYKARMKGSTIWNMIEYGLSKIEKHGGGFLHISGGKYHYDISKPENLRLNSLQVGNKKIQADKIYTVAVSEYILKGGDGFHLDGQYEIVNDTRPNKDVNILKTYFCQYDTLNPKLEERIQISGLNSSEENK